MGWSKSETHAILDQVLEFTGHWRTNQRSNQDLFDRNGRTPLGFAVATSLKPDILVTDEVLAVGDESYQKKCLNWMKSYRASGGALLLCSHSMYHVNRCVSRRSGSITAGSVCEAMHTCRDQAYLCLS